MIKVLMVSTDVGDEDMLLGDEVAHEESHDQAVEMGEVVEALVASLSRTVQRTSKLVVKMEGSVKLTGGAKAEAKYLFFNVGASGSAERTNTLTLSLETEIEPSGSTSGSAADDAAHSTAADS
jgi:hypothetical protein